MIKNYILSRIHILNGINPEDEDEVIFVRNPIASSTNINTLIELGENLLIKDFMPEDINGKLGLDSIKGVSDVSPYISYMEEYRLNPGDSSGFIIEAIDMI